MTKFYMMAITKKTDDQEYEEAEKVFVKKSQLKKYLKSEGYCKETKYQYIKIQKETMYVATVEKIKVQ
ncbi:hypothetical protein FCT18_03260 [Lysinibacillus sphaericus]|uniref:Uncharacterized protein n=1 Tax=Lysinibacillus sphaericus TaxID=1421 RepID=A0AAJ5DA68_LYSSH|nr:hypothetical protein [Lysinibacillus sphaericus]MED4544542.1 hypothetical protein [Lysinibacillus sphaericus]TKI20669.1 hypothetical protein FCT18_03260 [Lysinibacillus sphaericus]GEC80698.1 hypothetical protein LSP03_04410 [Lysinibacillus sphaericus]SUV18060.1 Uncharacterised protein [Lysinibacillus sphaericus]